MKKVKIIGAGSIGNHIANACRSFDWSVDLCDVDPAALERTRTSIYPGRYGQWDEAIRLHQADAAPKGGYDLIVIGTPPDSHITLALAALDEDPVALLVEKPLCGPDLDGAQALYDKVEQKRVRAFVGYDHVVGRASELALHALADTGATPVTIDVEFREHWHGIFGAHPWLDGPGDSYLGYWRRGGGASGEHSHALNLWQHFARAAGMGRVTEVSASMDFVSGGNLEYDRLCLLNLRTERGMVGRVVQDVVTLPARKWGHIQLPEGQIAWHCGYEPGCDAVETRRPGAAAEVERITKTRPDDFIRELTHIRDCIDSGTESPISLERGLDTMLVLAAAHLSTRTGRTVGIDYDRGYTVDAVAPIGANN